MKLTDIVLLITITMLFGCREKQPRFDQFDKKVIEMDIADLGLIDIGENVRIIPMPTADSCLLGRIAKIVEYRGNLFIQDRDQKAIFIFDHVKGQFIKKIRKVGNGPDEYPSIEDFTINPYTNHIEMIDGRNLRSYDFSGNLINKLRIIDDNIRAINRIAVVDSTLIAFLTLFDEYGARLYSKDTRSFITEQNLVPVWTRKKIPFQTANQLYRKNNEINYYEGFSNKVYQIRKEGFKLKYEWDFGKYNFNFDEPPLLNEFMNADSFRDIIAQRDHYCNNYIQSFQHNIENENFIVTCFLYKNKPATLIYSKQNNNYKVFAGDLSRLLMFSEIDLTDHDEVIVVANFSALKMLPSDWFSDRNADIISNTQITDNPLIIKFKMKDNLFIQKKSV